MSCSPPFIMFGGSNASLRDCSIFEVRSVVAISNTADSYSNFLNSYQNAINVVNNWAMNTIPWGQAVFVTFSNTANAYTNTNANAAQLNTAYTFQGLTLSNMAATGAALGICNTGGYAFGMIRSQAMISTNFSINGFGPQGCQPIIPLYVGDVVCCSNSSNITGCSNITMSGGIVNMNIPVNATLNATNLPNVLSGLDQATASVTLLLTKGGVCG